MARASAHARDLLAHRLPSRDVAEVLERALDALIGATVKQRFAQTDAPRPARPAKKRSRTIPAEVRREVFERDSGRCTFISEAGRRCDARAFIELDHATLFCRGGKHSAEVVRLMCRSHNQLGAEQALGKDAIDAAINWRRSQLTDRAPISTREAKPP